MRIRTRCDIGAAPSVVWPLLTGSTMDGAGWFCLGVPRPVACELPAGPGGVGAERRCVSDRGVVRQRITLWEPPLRLRFRMISTDHAWARCVSSLEEEFVLESTARGTRITRTTDITARGFGRGLRETAFLVGLKRVHLHVFRNWRRQAEGAAAPWPAV